MYKGSKNVINDSIFFIAINDIVNIELVNNINQQYLYILQYNAPKFIILCENGNFLNRNKLPIKWL